MKGSIEEMREKAHGKPKGYFHDIESKTHQPAELIPNEDAKHIGGLIGVKNYTIEQVHKIMELHKKHTKIPQKESIKMKPEDMVANMGAMLTPNQRYVHHELPEALKSAGK